jgi:hypothetical protein
LTWLCTANWQRVRSSTVSKIFPFHPIPVAMLRRLSSLLMNNLNQFCFRKRAISCGPIYQSCLRSDFFSCHQFHFPSSLTNPASLQIAKHCWLTEISHVNIVGPTVLFFFPGCRYLLCIPYDFFIFTSICPTVDEGQRMFAEGLVFRIS